LPLIESLRLHQWAKNLLLVVPALLAQVAGRPHVAWTLLLAFLAFSITASGNYLLNDLIDSESDRRHPHKRHRPIAAGRMPRSWALIAAPALMSGGIGSAWVLVNGPFALMLISYVLLAIAYSKFFKRLLLLDVMVLAALYTLRLLAGGAAVDVIVSSWLLVFSMFFFVSLAFAKRLAEVDALTAGQEARTSARAYLVTDRNAFAAIGPASGMLSVLVLALYVSSAEIRAHYTEPDVLWMLCPLLLYWILRVWFIALRGELHYDPVVFALHDRVSYAVVLAVVTVLFFAAGAGR
jgi:4-hydroxybenzoate polyprenyltransferase